VFFERTTIDACWWCVGKHDAPYIFLPTSHRALSGVDAPLKISLTKGGIFSSTVAPQRGVKNFLELKL
jgi:hypothetical protein